jgi:hypothetical protein
MANSSLSKAKKLARRGSRFCWFSNGLRHSGDVSAENDRAVKKENKTRKQFLFMVLIDKLYCYNEY